MPGGLQDGSNRLDYSLDRSCSLLACDLPLGEAQDGWGREVGSLTRAWLVLLGPGQTGLGALVELDERSPTCFAGRGRDLVRSKSLADRAGDCRARHVEILPEFVIIFPDLVARGVEVNCALGVQLCALTRSELGRGQVPARPPATDCCSALRATM
jgi:hypothetical protein